MTRVVLVRHGESVWNAQRRVQGQSGTGLSELGRRQAEVTAELLAELHPDAVLATSDLQRTRETAAPLERALGSTAQLEVGLRERHFGAWTGRQADELAAAEPDRWARWASGEDVIAEVGGEATDELTDRVVAVLRVLASIAGARPLVCVTHGGPVWHGTHALLQLDKGRLGGVTNCSVTELDVHDGHATMIAWNQATHLRGDLLATPSVGRARAPDVEDEDVPPPVGT